MKRDSHHLGVITIFVPSADIYGLLKHISRKSECLISAILSTTNHWPLRLPLRHGLNQAQAAALHQNTAKEWRIREYRLLTLP